MRAIRRKSGGRGGERGVSPVIGFILIIGFVVGAWGIYQTAIVPGWNEEAEFEHTEAVKADIVELQETIRTVGVSGDGQPVSVKLGTSYPNPPFSVPQPALSGQLSTAGKGQMVVTNAKAIQSETDDFWNGSSKQYSTQSLQYTVDYRKRSGGPTIVYEHSLVVSQYRADSVIESDQSLITGRSITLTTLAGAATASDTGLEEISITPVTDGMETVAVTDTGNPIRLQFPTQLSQSTWQNALEDQLVSNGGNVQSISYSERSGQPNLVTVTLATGRTYELNLGRVAIGQVSERTSAAYATITESGSTSIAPNATSTFEVQVRDRYNNPKSGVPVSATVASGPGSVSVSPSTTLSDGTVAVTYSAPESTSSRKTATVKVSLGGATGDAKTVTQKITVQPQSGDNESSPFDLELTADESQPGVSCDPDGEECTVNAGRVNVVDMTAELSPALSAKRVEINPTDTEHGYIIQRDLETNQDGIITSEFIPRQSGETTVKAEAAGASDQLVINVVGGDGNAAPVVTEISAEKRTDARTTYRANGFIIEYSIADPDNQFRKIKFEYANLPLEPYDRYFRIGSCSDDPANCTRQTQVEESLNGRITELGNNTRFPINLKWTVLDRNGNPTDSGYILLSSGEGGGLPTGYYPWYMTSDIRYSGDDDADGKNNLIDNCRQIPNPTQDDSDGDGLGDPCDGSTAPDTDGDGVPDPSDNCPSVSNPNPQSDYDADGKGNPCDNDDDNDGIQDDDENDGCETDPDTSCGEGGGGGGGGGGDPPCPPFVPCGDLPGDDLPRVVDGHQGGARVHG